MIPKTFQPDRVILDDETQLYRDLFALLDLCMGMSKTLRAGRLRQMCARQVICGDLTVDTIARRVGVSHRRVQQVMIEVYPHCLQFLPSPWPTE